MPRPIDAALDARRSSPDLRRPIRRPPKGGLRVRTGRNAAMSFLTPGPLQIDAEWMTAALRQAGAIRGARVLDITCDPVGNGLVGDSYRFGLTYGEVEPDAPASVIGKFPAI